MAEAARFCARRSALQWLREAAHLADLTADWSREATVVLAIDTERAWAFRRYVEAGGTLAELYELDGPGGGLEALIAQVPESAYVPIGEPKVGRYPALDVAREP